MATNPKVTDYHLPNFDVRYPSPFIHTRRFYEFSIYVQLVVDHLATPATAADSSPLCPDNCMPWATSALDCSPGWTAALLPRWAVSLPLISWGSSTSFYTFFEYVSNILRTSHWHKLYGNIGSSFGHQRRLSNFPYQIWQQVKYSKYFIIYIHARASDHRTTFTV